MEISSINLQGTSYGIKDAVARSTLSRLQAISEIPDADDASIKEVALKINEILQAIKGEV